MKRVQLVRYSTAAMASQTGLVGEVFVDLTKLTLVVNDGLTAGGFPLAREDLSNVADVTTSVAGKMTATDKIKLNTFPDTVTALSFIRGNAGGTAWEKLTTEDTRAALGVTDRNTVNYQVFGR